MARLARRLAPPLRVVFIEQRFRPAAVPGGAGAAFALNLLEGVSLDGVTAGEDRLVRPDLVIAAPRCAGRGDR